MNGKLNKELLGTIRFRDSRVFAGNANYKTLDVEGNVKINTFANLEFADSWLELSDD